MPAPSRPARGLKNGFLLESFDTLYRSLFQWRVDEELAGARKAILPFVRGLRFSALLIYRLRKVLQGLDLTASWGAVLNDSETVCSPECDIVVHRPCGCAHAWNGGDAVEGPVMDFRFIRRPQAKVVLSCKQTVGSVDAEMRKYAVSVMEYVPRVWLFAECCREGKQGDLERDAAAAGYERFWYLYALEAGGGERANEPGWLQFVEELHRLDAES